MKVGELIETKLCARCQTIKAKTEFNCHARNKDGLQSFCRTCTRIENAKYNAKAWKERRSDRLPKWICESCYGEHLITFATDPGHPTICKRCAKNPPGIDDYWNLCKPDLDHCAICAHEILRSPKFETRPTGRNGRVQVWAYHQYCWQRHVHLQERTKDIFSMVSRRVDQLATRHDTGLTQITGQLRSFEDIAIQAGG